MQQLLFQWTYSLILGWLLIAETQYRNIGKSCEEVFIKELRNSRKLRKVVAIYKTNKLVPFKK